MAPPLPPAVPCLAAASPPTAASHGASVSGRRGPGGRQRAEAARGTAVPAAVSPRISLGKGGTRPEAERRGGVLSGLALKRQLCACVC